MNKATKDFLGTETEEIKVLKKAFMEEKIEANDFIEETLTRTSLEKDSYLKGLIATEILFSDCLIKKINIQTTKFKFNQAQSKKINSLIQNFYEGKNGEWERQNLMDNLLQIYISAGWEVGKAIHISSGVILGVNLRREAREALDKALGKDSKKEI